MAPGQETKKIPYYNAEVSYQTGNYLPKDYSDDVTAAVITSADKLPGFDIPHRTDSEWKYRVNFEGGYLVRHFKSYNVYDTWLADQGADYGGGYEPERGTPELNLPIANPLTYLELVNIEDGIAPITVPSLFE